MKRFLILLFILSPLFGYSQFTVNYRMEGSTNEKFETITILRAKTGVKIFYNSSSLSDPVEANILESEPMNKENISFTILRCKFDEWPEDEYAIMYGYNPEGNFASIFNVKDVDKPVFRPAKFWLEHPESPKENTGSSIDWSSLSPLLKLLF